MNENADTMMNEHRCKNCGSYNVEDGYKLELCSECRNALARRPIPVKIKIFFGLIFILLIFSLYKFPSTFKTGIEYEKGLKAERQLKYVAAMKHYENVLTVYPNSEKTLVKLYNAYYQNERITEADKILDKLIGDGSSKKTVSKSVADEVNGITHNIDTYYSFSEELYTKMKTVKSSNTEDMIKVLKPYLDNHPNEAYGSYYLANSYFDLKKYNEGINVLDKLLVRYPDYTIARLLEASTFRELCGYDRAIECCERVLSHNSEDINAYIGLSKIELKRKHNEKGLEYAKKAYSIDSKDPYVIANLSLAYHYNNKIKESKEMLNRFKSLEPKDDYTIKFLTSIFDGTLQWQK